jgi:hypothetical protein
MGLDDQVGYDADGPAGLRAADAPSAGGVTGVCHRPCTGWPVAGRSISAWTRADNVTLRRLPPYAPELHRSKESGSTCASVISPIACTTATKPSSTPPVMRGAA